MEYNCKVKELSEQSTLTIRTRSSVQNLPQTIGSSYMAIMQYLEELKEIPVGAPFVIYYNMDMQDLDVEFGFPVQEGVEGKNNIQAGNTPGGRVATCLCIGPYSEIEPAYNALIKWIEDNRYEATGVAYEVYLNDPAQTPSQELKTQIALMLKTA